MCLLTIFVVLRKNKFLISYFVVFFPLQEDFLWWERQTGGGGVIKRPDGDHCRTQQCHTDKYHREQSMMGWEKPRRNPKHFFRQHQARNTAGVLISSALIYIFKATHTFRLIRVHFDCASFLVSVMRCLLLHPRSLSLGHKRFILFFYCYFI